MSQPATTMGESWDTHVVTQATKVNMLSCTFSLLHTAVTVLI